MMESLNDFYQIYSNKIQILENLDAENKLANPQTYQGSYSQIGKMCGKLEFVKFILSSPRKQIIEFKNENDCRFIFKRLNIICNKKYPEILEDQLLRKFVNEAIKEIVFARIISSHEAGINPLDLKITYVSSFKILVSEFLMEKPGRALSVLLLQPGYKIDFVKSFKQLISVVEFMDSHHVYHSGIQLEHCILDDKGNLSLVGYSGSLIEEYFHNSKIDKKDLISQFAFGYEAPEIYKQYKRMKEPNSESIVINENMGGISMIYSCGIVGLCLAGALNSTEITNIKELDKFKSNEKDHLNIFRRAKDIKIENIPLKEKIKLLLEMCLSYDPKNRITLKQLKIIMDKLDLEKYSANDLKLDILEFKYQHFNQELTTKEELIHENQNLNTKVSRLSEKLVRQSTLNNNNANSIFIPMACGNNEQNFLAKFEELFKQTKYINTNHITDFNQVFSIFLQMQEEIENLKEHKQKLLESSLLEYKNKGAAIKQIEETKEKPEEIKGKEEKSQKFSSYNLNKDKSEIKEINALNLRKEIQIEIAKKDFWNFYNKNMNKQEILTILELGSKSTSIKGINLDKNEEFNEECGKAYKKFIYTNESIQGVFLYNLKFLIEQQLKILKKIKKKKQIKYFIINKEIATENYVKEIANKLGWEINNWESKYCYIYLFDFLDYYCLHKLRFSFFRYYHTTLTVNAFTDR